MPTDLFWKMKEWQKRKEKGKTLYTRKLRERRKNGKISANRHRWCCLSSYCHSTPPSIGLGLIFTAKIVFWISTYKGQTCITWQHSKPVCWEDLNHLSCLCSYPIPLCIHIIGLKCSSPRRLCPINPSTLIRVNSPATSRLMNPHWNS